jgi:hypothetical protein
MTITMSGTEPVMRYERPAPLLGGDSELFQKRKVTR